MDACGRAINSKKAVRVSVPLSASRRHIEPTGNSALSQGLFRQEVIEAKRGEWLGSISLATPLSFTWWSLLALTMATVIVLFLTIGYYTRRESVTGQLLPSEGLLTLTAQTTGTVTLTLVHEGQRVAAGQPLAEISANLDTSMGDGGNS